MQDAKVFLQLIAGGILGAALAAPARAGARDDACRPEGMAASAVADVPYCLVYESDGREKLANALQRRNIGYFTGGRTGKDGKLRYLVSDIPWGQLTHINYAFAHIDADHKVSAHETTPGNAATDVDWPDVAAAAMDPALAYKGHFNLLNRFKKQYPGVKTLLSVGGWDTTGGYYGADGKRVDSGGFYAVTTDADGSVNSAGIEVFADSVLAFLRRYSFDGVDIDYEFPTTMPGAGYPLDWKFSASRQKGLQAGYRELMRVLREKLNAAAVHDRKYYLLTAAVPASSYLLRGMESFQALRYLDFVNVMSYDLHGTWNPFVGPQAPLFDNGQDTELASGKVYAEPLYKGIASLNVDWAYHYYRGAMPPSRINVGVPYYTRGWRGVSGGRNGLWGRSSSDVCPYGLKPPCGLGASGIDNIWFSVDAAGKVEDAGSNPLWHAKNLERNIPGDYLPKYGLRAADLSGRYLRYYDNALVAPWLWNESTRVFLSMEDEQSIRAKVDWIIANRIGGVMHWELAGDYDWDAQRVALNGASGQFVPGSTLTRLLAQALRKAEPAQSRLAAMAMPAEAVDLSVELTGFALGDHNFPIAPTLSVVNRTGRTIPQGSLLRFQYPVSAPDNWTATGMKVTSGPAGDNLGGLKGDFHTVEYILPGLAPGASTRVQVTYRLPITGPSNYRLIVNGKAFATRQEYPHYPTGSF
ncbi:MAG: glycosyl hydrolase family 18 protein [Rhodoferax sp.]